MTNHTGHGHLMTPAARANCRKFMAEHDGMDEVTYRVSVREQELDDAFENVESLRKAQRAYLDADAGTGSWDDYYAMVQMYAWDAGLDLDDAYAAVENGPCV
jgi:hypothetical protein